MQAEGRCWEGQGAHCRHCGKHLFDCEMRLRADYRRPVHCKHTDYGGGHARGAPCRRAAPDIAQMPARALPTTNPVEPFLSSCMGSKEGAARGGSHSAPQFSA